MICLCPNKLNSSRNIVRILEPNKWGMSEEISKCDSLNEWLLAMACGNSLNKTKTCLTLTCRTLTFEIFLWENYIQMIFCECFRK